MYQRWTWVGLGRVGSEFFSFQWVGLGLDISVYGKNGVQTIGRHDYWAKDYSEKDVH
jgi:hypothetical protein